MTTDWAHLPNAPHIDRVIAIANVSPHCRAVGWDKEWWAAPRDAAWSKAWNTVQDAGRSAEYKAAWLEAWYFARNAIVALIAYDDCAYMLDSDPGELAILAAFGDHRAVLILPACEILHSLKEIA